MPDMPRKGHLQCQVAILATQVANGPACAVRASPGLLAVFNPTVSIVWMMHLIRSRWNVRPGERIASICRRQVGLQ